MSEIINLNTRFAANAAPPYIYSSETEQNCEDIEEEIKEITENGSSKPFDLFTSDIENGLVEGIHNVRSLSKRIVISRQLDTPDGKLRELDISFRIRFTLVNGRIVDADANVKLPKHSEVGMKRGEYETRISDPSVIDIAALEKRYEEKLKKGLLPDLRIALNEIERLKNEIGERFLILVARKSNTIGLNSKIVGYDRDQKFYGEMVNDLINIAVRTPTDSFLVPLTEGSSELEVEPLRKACTYNPYPGSEDHVCRNLDSMDRDLGNLFIKDALAPYAEKTNTVIKSATLSKADRGFVAVQNYIDLVSSASGKTMDIKNTFMASAVGLVHVKAPPLVTRLSDINLPLELKAA